MPGAEVIKQIKKACHGMGFRVFGYILMDNHYHLMIQTLDKRLQDIMHQINNTYSKYFNYKYKRIGHVFQGRYKAILVQDERYMLSLLRYIHRNPVVAKMNNNVNEYRWSSDFFYRRNIEGFVHIETILKMLSADRTFAVQLYKEYMDISEEDKVDFEKKKIIGDEAYEIMLSSRKEKIERKRLDEILISTGVGNQAYELIKNGSRKRELTKYKFLYIIESIKYNYTHSEIGANINISDFAVRDIMNRVYATHRDLKSNEF